MRDPMQDSNNTNPWPERTERIAVVLFWVILASLTLLRRALDPRGPSGIDTPAVLFTLSEYVIWALITPAIFWLVHRYPFERQRMARRLVLHLGTAIVVAATIDLIRIVIIGPLILPAEVVAGRTYFNQGPIAALFRLQFLDEFVIYLAVLAAGVARDYFRRFREREAVAARLEAQLSEAHLAALRMQLNPHFLFNTLHAISALVERDPQGVRKMIARLSMLLRRVLDDGGTQEVALRDELQFLQDYFEIQQVRFQGTLVVEIDAEPDALKALVPNLILQPLAENAIEHGVSRLEESMGRIILRARKEADRLVITISDNGPGLATPEAVRDNGLGLRNTRQRLEALYGADQSLNIQSREQGGVVVMVSLPYHTANDLQAIAAPLPATVS